MQTTKTLTWVGRIMSGVAILFLLVDALGKLLELPLVVEATVGLGYPPSAVLGVGLTLLLCVLIYAVPKTALLGAVLITGFLGGAVATHVRVDSPVFTHTLFPVYVALLIWGGLLLRDARARAVFANMGGARS